MLSLDGKIHHSYKKKRVESDNNLLVDWKALGDPGLIEQDFAPVMAKSKRVCNVEIPITTGNIFLLDRDTKLFLTPIFEDSQYCKEQAIQQEYDFCDISTFLALKQTRRVLRA